MVTVQQKYQVEKFLQADFEINLSTSQRANFSRYLLIIPIDVYEEISMF